MSDMTLAGPTSAARSCSPAARITRSLLGYGVIAGPFYVALVVAQGVLRPGFDLARDDASLLSLGSLGWIQIVTFVLTGLMVVACAAGVGRALAGGRGAVAGMLLLALFGIGLIGAGVFVADPMNGFPPGTPPGRPASVSVHGMLHIASAGLGFLGFAGACLVIGQRFAAERRRRWTWFSRLTGVLFLAGFAGLASGSGSALVVIGFWIVLVLAWTWLALVAIHLYRRVAA